LLTLRRSLVGKPERPVNLDVFLGRTIQIVPPHSSPVTLLQRASHVLGVVFFDQMSYKKIPVYDENLHQNIFWRR
jgi:hypothetical protein